MIAPTRLSLKGVPGITAARKTVEISGLSVAEIHERLSKA
jgi:hypothetical protein